MGGRTIAWNGLKATILMLVVLYAVLGYGLFDEKACILKDDFSFSRMDLNGKNEEPLLRDPALGRSLFSEEDRFRVEVLSDDLIFFWGKRGEWLGNRLPYRFVEEGVAGFEPYPPLQRVLLWKKDRLGVLDASVRPEEKTVFEEGPRLAWVFKEGQKIEQAYWVYEGSHILFRDKDRVLLLEIEAYGKPHLDLVSSVKSKSSVFYSEESGKLYYLENTKGRLLCVGILPRKEPKP